MAKIIVFPYCPIHSHEKIRCFTTEKDRKSAREKRLLSCIFDLLSCKIRKKGESGAVKGFFGKYSKKGVPRDVCIFSDGIIQINQRKPEPENRLSSRSSILLVDPGGDRPS
ncbi:MAG: hypothetical protein WC379_13005 [Methanoregula sp.]